MTDCTRSTTPLPIDDAFVTATCLQKYNTALWILKSTINESAENTTRLSGTNELQSIYKFKIQNYNIA